MASHLDTIVKKSYVFATSNPHKVEEVQAIVGNQMDLVVQSEYGIPEIEETGLTFIENAILKARNASRLAGLPAMADDSGLEVDALRGAPGIFSARFAGPDASDEANNRKLLDVLSEVPEAMRTARFQCVIVVFEHAEDPAPLVCQGTWHGAILTAPRGQSGFGYDPLFLVPDRGLSAAELPEGVKNRISHRAIALQQLASALQNR